MEWIGGGAPHLQETSGRRICSSLFVFRPLLRSPTCCQAHTLGALMQSAVVLSVRHQGVRSLGSFSSTPTASERHLGAGSKFWVHQLKWELGIFGFGVRQTGGARGCRTGGPHPGVWSPGHACLEGKATGLHLSRGQKEGCRHCSGGGRSDKRKDFHVLKDQGEASFLRLGEMPPLVRETGPCAERQEDDSMKSWGPPRLAAQGKISVFPPSSRAPGP